MKKLIHRLPRWLPNALSISRAPAGVVILAVMITSTNWGLGYGLLLWGLASDFGDGLLASAIPAQTALGAELDQLGDGFTTWGAILGAAFAHTLPWWIVAMLFAGMVLSVAAVRFLPAGPTRRVANVVLPFGYLAEIVGLTLLYGVKADVPFTLQVSIALPTLTIAALAKQQRIKTWLRGES